MPEESRQITGKGLEDNCGENRVDSFQPGRHDNFAVLTQACGGRLQSPIQIKGDCHRRSRRSRPHKF